MKRVLAEYEEAYDPSSVMTPPGSGTEGDDPAGVNYAKLGPLAFVLCEALQSAILRGADRDALIERIVETSDASIEDVDAILTGKELCPSEQLIMAFGTVLSIDATIIVDAAIKGGCTKLRTTYSPVPPGY